MAEGIITEHSSAHFQGFQYIPRRGSGSERMESYYEVMIRRRTDSVVVFRSLEV